MPEIALCPLCKIPSAQNVEGEVCPQHPQRVLVNQSVVDQHQDDFFIGLLLDGKYELCRPLGHGGFGSVYYAVQRGQIRREVAIKLLTRQSPEYLDLFRDEMRMVAQLRSPYTVRYLDSGVHTDLQLHRELPYMVMEYLQGETLAHRLINRGAIAPTEAIELFDHLLDSLDEAHSFGIVHRDLKPLNLMITPTRQGGSRMTVLDFGVARVIDQASRDATRNRIMGTPYYLAPEVLLQQEVTPQGDLFAVGVILYETLMCRSPFLNEELQGVEPYLRLRSLYKSEAKYEPISPQLLDQFSTFFDQALAVSVEKRFKDAGEMREALQACLSKASKPMIHDTQFDLPKIEFNTEAQPATLANLSAQSLRVQLNSDDQTILADREDKRSEAKTIPLTATLEELLPQPLSSPSIPSPSPYPSPMQETFDSQPNQKMISIEHAPTDDHSINQIETSPFLPLEHVGFNTHKASKTRWSLFISGAIFIAIIGFMIFRFNQNQVDPCVLTRSPSGLSPSLLEGDLISPPEGDRITRLRAIMMMRPCLDPTERGCQENVLSCPINSVYAQTEPLTAQEFTHCQQAGMCDADSSPQGTQIQRCSPEKDQLCVPALIAYKYCTWRGLTIPTINAWYRMIQESELRTNTPQWGLSPSGEIIKLTPQFEQTDKGLGTLLNLELGVTSTAELLSNTDAPIASIRCIKAYQSK